MTRSISSLLLVATLITSALPLAHAQDDQGDVASSLGLTANNGSLPLWAKPEDQARRDLGQFIRAAQQGVLLVGHPRHGRGTAWVISREHRLLATNAHVADIMHSAGGEMLAVLNGTSTIYTVERTWYHPGVRRLVGGVAIKSTDPSDGPIYANCPDVAVLQLAAGGEELPTQFEMARPDQFEQLLAETAAILGYPGHDTQAWPSLGEAAVATYHDGVISRFTDFHNSVSVPIGERQFLQYTMSTWGGFSGSPIFLPTGEVIAIHNSARYETGAGGDVQALPHGVRIDCLWELIAHHGLDSMVPLPVDRTTINVQRWLEDDPEDIAARQAISLVNEGSDLIYNQQKFTEGVRKCNEALKLAPNYAQAYNVRVDGYLNYWFKYRRQVDRDTAFKQLQYAERDALKYLNLNPSDPWAAINLVLVYNNAGQFLENDGLNQRALEIVSELLQSENLPDSIRASAYSNRAIAYDNLDADDQALGDHNEAVRLSPNNAQLYENRADFWHYQGRYDLEEADYEKARKLRQGN